MKMGRFILLIKIKTMIRNKSVKVYSENLLDRAMKESFFFPVDRKFILENISQILSFDRREFLCVNLEFESDLYVCQLMRCLPELWLDIGVDIVLSVSDLFNNEYAYFNLFKFSYRYLEIDIAEALLDRANQNGKIGFYKRALENIRTMSGSMTKHEGDVEDFEDGTIDIDIRVWANIVNDFLRDSRVRLAVADSQYVIDYVDYLYHKY